MKLKLKLLLSVLFIAGAGLRPASSFAAFTPLKTSIAVPAASLDFSDLDARDKNNRPLKSAAAKAQLENLFQTSLIDLLMTNMTPTKRAMLWTLSQCWSTVHGWWLAKTTRAVNAVSIWFETKKSKFLHTVVRSSGSTILQKHSHLVLSMPAMTQISSIISSTQILR